jgi:hypothetical protein
MDAVSVDRIVVEQTDLVQADADVLVVPATSSGTFGPSWSELVGRLAGLERVEEIELGGLRTVPVTTARAVLLAFAATRGPGEDAGERIVESIGRALADLSRDNPAVRVIASPSLGTGAGRLPLERSVPALVRGFLAEPCDAQLMLVAREPDVVDRIKAVLGGEDAGSVDEASGTTGATTDRMFASSVADTVPLPGAGRVRAADRLDTAADVEMLASVILARNTSLPLAIGLFGDWGSGKSFFMAQLEERLDELSQTARTDEQSPFLSELRQIRFNAWHYVDADLWSSIASTIFDGLAVTGADGTRLDEARTALGEAAKEAEQARRERLSAEREVRLHQEEANRSAQKVLTTLPALVQELTRAPDPDAPTTPGADSGSRPTLVAADQVAVLTGFWAQLKVAARAGWAELRASRGWTIGFLALAVVLGVVATQVASSGWFAALLRVVVPLLTALAPALTFLTRALNGISKARKAREAELHDVQLALTRARVREEQAVHAVERQQEQLDLLRDRGAQLQTLVQSAAVEYRSGLGIMSRLRKDFEQLTLLVGARPDGPDDAAPRPLREAARTLANAENDIERIVLYIDDLDRCSPDQVVKVLQAVHLLLAFRLFVVVLGVDSRWLEASLAWHYETLLEKPADYLEKIIQVPFLLRPMTKDGFSSMMSELSRPPVAQSMPAQRGEGTAGMQGTTYGAAIDTGGSAGPASEPVAPPPGRALTLTQPELDLLASLGDVVPSPRAGKRLLNIYRMLRVSADNGDALTAEDSPDSKVVVLLLGLLVGCPDEASEVFTTLAGADSGSFWEILRSGDHRGALTRLAPLKPLAETADLATVQLWLPRVRRFSYRMSRTPVP